MTETKHSKPRVSEQIRVECFMLCDYAKEENQKLYIVGGGWNRIEAEELPFALDFSLAIKIVATAPISEEPLYFVIETSNDEGNLVTEPAELTIIPRNRRPNHSGSEAPLFLPLEGALEIQERGRYTVTLRINGDPVAQTKFFVHSSHTSEEGREADSIVGSEADSNVLA